MVGVVVENKMQRDVNHTFHYIDWIALHGPFCMISWKKNTMISPTPNKEHFIKIVNLGTEHGCVHGNKHFSPQNLPKQALNGWTGCKLIPHISLSWNWHFNDFQIQHRIKNAKTLSSGQIQTNYWIWVRNINKVLSKPKFGQKSCFHIEFTAKVWFWRFYPQNAPQLTLHLNFPLKDSQWSDKTI